MTVCVDIISFFHYQQDPSAISSLSLLTDLSSLQMSPFIPTNETPLELDLFANNKLKGSEGNWTLAGTQLCGSGLADHLRLFSDLLLLAWSSKYLYPVAR